MTNLARCFALGLVLSWSLAACGVTAEVASDVPFPHRLAVLPLKGDGRLEERDLMRSLLRERLRVRNTMVLDNAYVDHVLSQRGWLTDPERFDPGALDLAAACTALQVDGVLVGTGFGRSNVDLGLFFREGVGGDLRGIDAQKRQFWRASYTAHKTGGLLVRSGQILTAISEQSEKGTPQAYVRLAEEYLDAVLDTLPDQGNDQLVRTAAPTVASIDVAARDHGTVVTVHATPGCRVLLDFSSAVHGVPAFETSPGIYRGVGLDIADASPGPQVTVRVLDPYGQSAEQAWPSTAVAGASW